MRERNTGSDLILDHIVSVYFISTLVDGQWSEDLRISTDQAVEFVKYFLEEVDLDGDTDPRLKLLELIKGAKIIPGHNDGGQRIELGSETKEASTPPKVTIKALVVVAGKASSAVHTHMGDQTHNHQIVADAIRYVISRLPVCRQG